MKTIVIGIDPATKTGLCAFDVVGTASHLMAFSEVCYEGPKSDYGMRLVWFMEKVATFVDRAHGMVGRKDAKVHIYMERPHHRGAAATRYGYGYDAMVHIVSYQASAFGLKTEVTRVHTGTLKKYATGSGTATKDEMVEAAVNEMSKVPLEVGDKVILKDKITDNIADSYFLAKYGAEIVASEAVPAEELN